MSALRIVRRSPVVVATAFGLVVFAWAQEPAPRKAPPDEKPVHVSAFGKLPIGYLGVPLGTVVRVTGEVVDSKTTMRRADLGKTILRVLTVDGKKLAQSTDFEFLRAPDSVKPKLGENFDYYVHEYGEFDGIVTPPKELGIDAHIVANDGFYYRRHLTVHASNPVSK